MEREIAQLGSFPGIPGRCGSVLVALGLLVSCAEDSPPAVTDRALEQGCESYDVPLSEACRFSLAWYYAPVVYQNTEDPRRDFITRFDFDGDLDPTNQAEHVGDPSFPLEAYVYYAVIEGRDHYFLTYAFYHPVDYKSLLPHENDIEGILLTIARENPGPGRLMLMETLAHDQFYQYYSDLDVRDRYQIKDRGYEDRDGAVSIRIDEVDGRIVARRAEIIIESKGHGVYANGSNKERPGATFIQYVPSPDGRRGEQPAGVDERAVGYGLLDLEGSPFWSDRRSSQLFESSYEHWNGAGYESNDSRKFLSALRDDGRARPPWAWDDRGDNSVRRGDWVLAPAYAMARHLSVPGLTPDAISDPEYYERHPFLEDGRSNPPMEATRSASTTATAAPRALPPPNDETVHLFDGEELLNWAGADPLTRGIDDSLRRDARGGFLRIGGESTRSVSSLGELGAENLWVPLEQTNWILLRYTNPAGIPAAELHFRTARGDRDNPQDVRDHLQHMLLPSLTAVAEDGSRHVDATRALLETDGDAEGSYLMSMRVVLSGDLGPWGASSAAAEDLPEEIPSLIREQYGRFVESPVSARVFDVIAIEVLTSDESQ